MQNTTVTTTSTSGPPPTLPETGVPFEQVRGTSFAGFSFVLAGMADNKRRFQRTPVRYYPYVEASPGAGKGLLEALAAIDPNRIAPLEALNLLADLRRVAGLEEAE